MRLAPDGPDNSITTVLAPAKPSDDIIYSPITSIISRPVSARHRPPPPATARHRHPPPATARHRPVSVPIAPGLRPLISGILEKTRPGRTRAAPGPHPGRSRAAPGPPTTDTRLSTIKHHYYARKGRREGRNGRKGRHARFRSSSSSFSYSSSSSSRDPGPVF